MNWTVIMVQGWTKITFPCCVNMRWNNCIFLPVTGAENAIVSHHIHRTWEDFFCTALYLWIGSMDRIIHKWHMQNSCCGLGPTSFLVRIITQCISTAYMQNWVIIEHSLLPRCQRQLWIVHSSSQTRERTNSESRQTETTRGINKTRGQWPYRLPSDRAMK